MSGWLGARSAGGGLALALVLHEMVAPRAAHAQGVFQLRPLMTTAQLYDSNLFFTRTDRQSGIEHPANGVDLGIRNNRRAIPSLAEDPGQPVGLHDFDVAGLVEGMAKKEIAGEHRLPDEMADTVALRPDGNQRQKRVERFREQLIVNELLGVTVRPQRAPSFFNCQGFAPFGSQPVVEVEPCVLAADDLNGRDARSMSAASSSLMSVMHSKAFAEQRTSPVGDQRV